MILSDLSKWPPGGKKEGAANTEHPLTEPDLEHWERVKTSRVGAGRGMVLRKEPLGQLKCQGQRNPGQGQGEDTGVRL